MGRGGVGRTNFKGPGRNIVNFPLGISKNLDNQDIKTFLAPVHGFKLKIRNLKDYLKRRKIFERGDDEGRGKRIGDVDNDRRLTDGKNIEQSAAGIKRQGFAIYHPNPQSPSFHFQGLERKAADQAIAQKVFSSAAPEASWFEDVLYF